MHKWIFSLDLYNFMISSLRITTYNTFFYFLIKIKLIINWIVCNFFFKFFFFKFKAKKCRLPEKKKNKKYSVIKIRNPFRRNFENSISRIAAWKTLPFLNTWNNSPRGRNVQSPCNEWSMRSSHSWGVEKSLDSHTDTPPWTLPRGICLGFHRVASLLRWYESVRAESGRCIII